MRDLVENLTKLVVEEQLTLKRELIVELEPVVIRDTDKNSPIYTIGNVETSSEEFIVPITCKDFNNINNWEHFYKWDLSKMEFVDIENKVDQTVSWFVWSLKEDKSTLELNVFYPLLTEYGLTLPDDTVL